MHRTEPRGTANPLDEQEGIVVIANSSSDNMGHGRIWNPDIFTQDQLPGTASNPET